MATNKYHNGIAASGLAFVLNDIEMSGEVWYVGTGGTDGASPAGRDYELPLATIAQAVTNAADDDIIILKSGYTATLTAVQALSKRLTLIGEGTSSGQPSVQLTLNNAANASMFTPSAISVGLWNIKIKTNSQANTAALVSVTGGAFWMRNCYFEGDANNDGPMVALESGADNCVIENTYFVSTQALVAGAPVAGPESGLKVAAAITNLRLIGNVFDDGVCGFSSGYAFHASTAAVTRLQEEQSSYLRGASATIHASTTRWIGLSTDSGQGRRLW